MLEYCCRVKKKIAYLENKIFRVCRHSGREPKVDMRYTTVSV